MYLRLKSLSAVDYIVALFALIILGYAFLYFTTKSAWVYIKMTPQNQDTSFDEPPPTYRETDAIHVGDSVYNSLGQRMAEVVDANTINYGGTKKFLKIVIKLKAKYNPRTKIYSFNETPLLIGNLLSLSLGQVSFKGKIIAIYNDPKDKYKGYTLKTVVATVLFRGVEPTHAEAMKTFEAKDSKGDIIAKTLSAEINPQEMDVTTDRVNGRSANVGIAHGYSTIFKDVTLKLLLPNVPCSNNTCFFNDTIDLKIGVDYFWIHSNTTLLSNGIITNLEYQNKPEIPATLRQ